MPTLLFKDYCYEKSVFISDISLLVMFINCKNN